MEEYFEEEWVSDESDKEDIILEDDDGEMVRQEDEDGEYIYDEINGGRGKKHVLSDLNKKKLSVQEMDEMFAPLD